MKLYINYTTDQYFLPISLWQNMPIKLGLGKYAYTYFK